MSLGIEADTSVQNIFWCLYIKLKIKIRTYFFNFINTYLNFIFINNFC